MSDEWNCEAAAKVEWYGGVALELHRVSVADAGWSLLHLGLHSMLLTLKKEKKKKTSHRIIYGDIQDSWKCTSHILKLHITRLWCNLV